MFDATGDIVGGCYADATLDLKDDDAVFGLADAGEKTQNERGNDGYGFHEQMIALLTCLFAS